MFSQMWIVWCLMNSKVRLESVLVVGGLKRTERVSGDAVGWN